MSHATNGAVKIVVEGLKIRVALAHKAAFVFGRGGQSIGQKAQGIGIPGRDIQIGTRGEMVKIGDLAHVVVGNGVITVFADDVGLQPVETDHLVAGKASVGHNMGRVRLGYRQVRQVYVVKTVVIHRPEHIAPSPVQRIRRLIALRQPIAEGMGRCGGIRQRGVVAGIFIVGLPGRHKRIAAIPRSHFGGDFRTFGAVRTVTEAVVATRAKTAGFAILVNGQHVGMFG